MKQILEREKRILTSGLMGLLTGPHLLHCQHGSSRERCEKTVVHDLPDVIF